MKTNNTWNSIRRSFNETIVSATQRIILKIVGFLVFRGRGVIHIWPLLGTYCVMILQSHEIIEMAKYKDSFHLYTILQAYTLNFMAKINLGNNCQVLLKYRR